MAEHRLMTDAQFAEMEERRNKQFDRIFALLDTLLQRQGLPPISSHGAANSLKERPNSKPLNVALSSPMQDDFRSSTKPIEVPSVRAQNSSVEVVTPGDFKEGIMDLSSVTMTTLTDTRTSLTCSKNGVDQVDSLLTTESVGCCGIAVDHSEIVPSTEPLEDQSITDDSCIKQLSYTVSLLGIQGQPPKIELQFPQFALKITTETIPSRSRKIAANPLLESHYVSSFIVRQITLCPQRIWTGSLNRCLSHVRRNAPTKSRLKKPPPKPPDQCLLPTPPLNLSGLGGRSNGPPRYAIDGGLEGNLGLSLNYMFPFLFVFERLGKSKARVQELECRINFDDFLSVYGNLAIGITKVQRYSRLIPPSNLFRGVAIEKNMTIIVLGVSEIVLVLMAFLCSNEFEIQEKNVKVVSRVAGIDTYKEVLVRNVMVVPWDLIEFLKHLANAWAIPGHDGVFTLLIKFGVLRNLCGVKTIHEFMVNDGHVSIIVRLVKSKEINIMMIQNLHAMSSSLKSCISFHDKFGGTVVAEVLSSEHVIAISQFCLHIENTSQSVSQYSSTNDSGLVGVEWLRDKLYWEVLLLKVFSSFTSSTALATHMEKSVTHMFCIILPHESHEIFETNSSSGASCVSVQINCCNHLNFV